MEVGVLFEFAVAKIEYYKRQMSSNNIRVSTSRSSTPFGQTLLLLCSDRVWDVTPNANIKKRNYAIIQKLSRSERAFIVIYATLIYNRKLYIFMYISVFYIYKMNCQWELDGQPPWDYDPVATHLSTTI